MHSQQQKTFQNHPLYYAERKIVDRLLTVEDPQKQDITECARLIIRYDKFPGAYDLQEDLETVMNNWNMDRDGLNKAARLIWTGGWRPDTPEETEIGSGADVTST
jgi:hypothetical protein